MENRGTVKALVVLAFGVIVTVALYVGIEKLGAIERQHQERELASRSAARMVHEEFQKLTSQGFKPIMACARLAILRTPYGELFGTCRFSRSHLRVRIYPDFDSALSGRDEILVKKYPL